MTRRHLKILIAVADTGSMTAAAETLFISQPSVSQAISEIENHYGIRLFERLSRKLYITDAGKRFLSYARHITSLFDELEQTMGNADCRGTIRIGASLTVGTYLLPGLVKEFCRLHPSVRVSVITRNTRKIEGLIAHNEVDFAIVEGIVTSPDIESTGFMDDELCFVCGRGYKLYGCGEIRPWELEDIEFIIREKGSGTRELFESYMDANGIKADVSWECNGSDGLRSAAVSGLGVAVMSRSLLEDDLESGDLHEIRVEGANLRRRFSFIHHKNKYMTGSMKSFRDMCMESGSIHKG